jgi:phosphonate transport system substrate-binding protein
MIIDAMNPIKPTRIFWKPPGIAAGILLVVLLLNCSLAVASDDSPLFRIGFSHTLFTDVNENDAKAALKVWSQVIARERGFTSDPETRIFPDTAELLRTLQTKRVDAVGITTLEYAAVIREVQFAPIFICCTGGKNREQYLVLVHRDSNLHQLSDLHGRSLTFHQNARACLAQPWLDTLMIEETGKTIADWVGKVTQAPKLSQTVLPVFFRQNDACVVTLGEFETMCELNPQIGQRLKILARSPEVVTTVFCFRADYDPVFKEQIMASLRDLHNTPAGQQVLTIFQSERIEDQPVSCLDSTLALLARHTKIVGSLAASNSPQKTGTLQSAKGVDP